MIFETLIKGKVSGILVDQPSEQKMCFLYFGVLFYMSGSWTYILLFWTYIWVFELICGGLGLVFRGLGLVISCKSCSLILVL